MGRLWYVPFKKHSDVVSMTRNWTSLEEYLNSLELKEVGPIGGGEKTASAGAPSSGEGEDGDWRYTTSPAAIYIKVAGAWVQMFAKYTDAEAAAKVASDDLYLQTAGDTMTGALTLNGDPTSALHAAPKQYVDALLSPLAGAWLFNTATTSSPSAGNVQFDNVATASVTNVYIHQTGNGSVDRTILTGLIANTDTLLIASSSSPGDIVKFTASGAPSVAAGVVTVPVTYVDHDGTVPWTLNNVVVLGVR